MTANIDLMQRHEEFVSVLLCEGRLFADSDEPTLRKVALQVSENDETDTFAYQNGYITVTPLKFDWTSYESLEQIRGWNLELSN